MASGNYSRIVERVGWMLDRWGTTGQVREPGETADSYFEHLWTEDDLEYEADPNTGIPDWYAKVEGQLYDVWRIGPTDTPNLYTIKPESGWIKSGETAIPTAEVEYDPAKSYYIETSSGDRVWQAYYNDFYRLDQINVPAALQEPMAGGGPVGVEVKLYRTTYSMTEREIDLAQSGDLVGILEWPADAGREIDLSDLLFIDGERLSFRQLFPVHPGGTRLFYKWVASYDPVPEPPA